MGSHQCTDIDRNIQKKDKNEQKLTKTNINGQKINRKDRIRQKQTDTNRNQQKLTETNIKRNYNCC